MLASKTRASAGEVGVTCKLSIPTQAAVVHPMLPDALEPVLVLGTQLLANLGIVALQLAVA